MRSQLGFVPRSPIAPVTNGRSSGERGLPKKGLRDAAPKELSNLDHLGCSRRSAGSDQDRDFAA